MLHYIDVEEVYAIIVLSALKEDGVEMEEEEEEEAVGIKRIRSGACNSFHADVTTPLKKWIIAHRNAPYPSMVEKSGMMQESGLTDVQLNDWLSNARRRLLKNVRYTRPHYRKKSKII